MRCTISPRLQFLLSRSGSAMRQEALSFYVGGYTFHLAVVVNRDVAAYSIDGIDRDKTMFHFSVCAFGRRYSLQPDNVWARRSLGRFWSYRESADCVRCHCGNWVLWVGRERAAGRRIDLE